MPAIPIDSSYGYATFTPNVPGQPPVDITLDLYEANEAYVALARTHEGNPGAIWPAWNDWLTGKGFPPLSYAGAAKVLEHVQEEIGRLGKPVPGSPTQG